MERCEPPRARRAGARRRRRRRPLADWQLRDIARVASQHRAAGYHAVKVHGVLIVFRHTREVQHAGDGRGHQRTVGDAPTASSAKPEQLSKRKQRSSMRLADFRRRMEQRDQAAASKLRRLWSVVWLQRLVRRRLGERSRLAARVAIVGEPGADAGLQKAKADASEACVAPVGSAATFRAAAVAAPKRKVGSGAEVSPAKAVARLGALSTSPADRPEAAEAAAAVAAAAAAADGGTRVPSAAEGKRRVDFGAPVPPSKRGSIFGWATSGGRAIQYAAASAAAAAAAAAAAEAAAAANDDDDGARRAGGRWNYMGYGGPEGVSGSGLDGVGRRARRSAVVGGSGASLCAWMTLPPYRRRRGLSTIMGYFLGKIDLGHCVNMNGAPRIRAPSRRSGARSCQGPRGGMAA